MTILRGHLAVTLVVAVGDEVETAALAEGLEEVRSRLALESVSLAEVEELDVAGAVDASHIVSVYGADHPGILHAVSSALAAQGWNITDLETRLAAAGSAGPLYAIAMEVALGADAATEDLERVLEPVARSERVEVSCRPLEREAL